MKRGIESAALRLRWILLLLWGALVLFYLAGRLGLSAGPLRIETRAEAGDSGALLVVADLSMILLTAALFPLGRMLAAIAAGEFFSARVTASFRAFAMWLLLLALVWIVVPVLATLLDGPGADQELQFRLQLRDVLTVGITLILFLVARLLERAGAIEEEMREFV